MRIGGRDSQLRQKMCQNGDEILIGSSHRSVMRRYAVASAMCLIALLCVASCFLAPVARAADAVDLALVLVSDVSRSIDDLEFKLEKEGYASAFASKQVIDAIQSGSIGTIAVAYVEFASSFEVSNVLDWSVIHDQASAQAFVDKLVAAPRSFWGRTAISSGIDRAVQLLAESGFDAKRRVIDVCGDGTNNAGRDVTEFTRRRAEGRSHHQWACYHKRASGVVDVRPCTAAGWSAELLSGKCHRGCRQLRAGSA